MTLSRREFLKNLAIGSAVTAASQLIPGVSFAWEKPTSQHGSDITWKKAPCRFCGTGCGLLIGVSEGRAVAVKGDPQSAVNKGLLCVKGYHSIQALYGEDRLKKAMIRKNGQMVEVPIKEALDLIAQKIKETIQNHGKDAVSMYGSGQWTIPDGYAASKLMKGCIGTNNLEANARLCMASAVTGFMTTFGLDEPMGCYEDMDHADTFFLWGNNMSEMHPVLFSRILERKRTHPRTLIIDFATRSTRTSVAADRSILFRPQSDLAVANAICYELFRTQRIDLSFLQKHCSFRKGKTQIGYGLQDKFAFQDTPEITNLDEYKKFLEDYTPEKVEKISGVSAEDIRYMASLYGDPTRNVVSYWCMGMNQHTRGTWINNLVYNIHLLVGKISRPGNGPFSLTGQPSACGTVREVGTLTHKLPKGVVMDPKARKVASDIWKVPYNRIPAKPTYDTVEMFRALDRGDIRFMWIQTTNPMVTMPNLRRYRDATKKEGRFIVVSEIYPTPTTAIADVILPSAMWIEREGMFGNSERRTQHWEKMVNPPGDAMSDTWQIIEVARRMGFTKEFPWSEDKHIEHIWNEYIRFHDNPAHRMADYETLKREPGVIWPYVNGKSTQWRYNTQLDPATKRRGGTVDFYGKPEGKAWIWLRPYEAAPEEPSKDFPFWLNTGRVLEHWHTGSMTRRIPTLHQAVPASYVELHPLDAKRLNIRHGDKVKLTSPRGSIIMNASLNQRACPPVGQVFVPFFDENYLINELTLDAYCPISRQPDYKKCAVRVERA